MLEETGGAAYYVLLNADTLSAELVASTLNLVLKHESDVEKAKAQLPQLAGS